MHTLWDLEELVLWAKARRQVLDTVSWRSRIWLECSLGGAPANCCVERLRVQIIEMTLLCILFVRDGFPGKL